MSGSLFDSTSRKAGEAAARSTASRRERILHLLGERGPLALFEVAEAMGLYDHQISGRFTELMRDGLIEVTGERRKKPATGCEAEVYTLRQSKPRPLDLGDAMGYPLTLTMGDEGRFERTSILERDAPGIPYARSSDGTRPRLTWRVALVECDGCGRPLMRTSERVAGQDRVIYRCNTPGCNRTWHLMIVTPPGSSPVLALVMRHL